MLSKKRLALFSVVVGLTVSTVLGTVKLSTQSSRMVKEGKIRDIEYYFWDFTNTAYPEIAVQEYQTGSDTRKWSKPLNTVLHFEDGEIIAFVGILETVERGKKYRIVYHEQYVQAPGNFYWNGNYHAIDNIEEIE